MYLLRVGMFYNFIRGFLCWLGEDQAWVSRSFVGVSYGFELTMIIFGHVSYWVLCNAVIKGAACGLSFPLQTKLSIYGPMQWMLRLFKKNHLWNNSKAFFHNIPFKLHFLIESITFCRSWAIIYVAKLAITN